MVPALVTLKKAKGLTKVLQLSAMIGVCQQAFHFKSEHGSCTGSQNAL